MATLKQIDGFPDYQISDTGYVLSFKFDPSGKILKFGYRCGYRYVVLSNSNPSAIPVHRLVAKAFIPNPDNKREVNHKNFNRQDNRVENLEWATRKENSDHAYINGQYPFGEKNGKSKLKKEEVIEIRKLHISGGRNIKNF